VRAVDGRPPVTVDVSKIEGLPLTEALLVADFIREVRALRRSGAADDSITLRVGDLDVLATASGGRPEELLAKIAPALRKA
jgi:hypothetical protein